MRTTDKSTTTRPISMYAAYVRLPGWSLLRHPATHADPIKGPRTTRRPRIKPMHALLSMLLLGAGLSAQAQTFHLSGGFSGSDVRESGDEQWKGRGGYQFGVDVLIGDRLFIKPGAHFVVRNLNYTLLDENTLTAHEYKYRSNSLSVPLLLGANLIDPQDGNMFNAYMMAGPTALIDLKTDMNNDAINVTTKGTQWYLGGAGGLGYGPVFLEAGYHVAMTNVFKGESFSTNPKVNYAYVIVGVRLRFPGHA